MSVRSPRAELGWLLLAALVLFTAGLGLRDPWPADEPRFALIARDMVHSGRWLFPRIAGELYADKPPLFIWLTALFYALTGELRIAFLLPSLLAGLGMLALVHDLARRLWNRRVALAAGVLLLASLQFTLQSRTAQLDALVALWTTLGLYGLLRHLLLGPDWRWYAAGGFAMGLGIITKGVGFLPLLVLLPWAWLRWRRPDALPRIDGTWRQWLLAPVAMLVPIACWLVPMLLATWWSGDPALAAYRDELLFRQTVTRYASTWTHLRPAWYYLVEVIPWAWLPGTLALPWLLPAWRRRLARGDARYWLLLGFAACVVVFFSLSPGKRGVYLLPALPAFVLAAAPLAEGLLRRAGLRMLCLALVVVVGAGALVAGVALVLDIGGLGERVARQGFSAAGVAGLAGLLGVAGVGLAVLGRARRREPAALLALFAVGWLTYGWLGQPLMNEARSAVGLMAEVRRAVPSSRPLAMMGWKEQLMLQVDRPVVHFGFRREPKAELRDAASWLEGEPGGVLLVAASQMAPCLDGAKAQPVALRHGRAWMLADAAALTGECAGAVGEAVRFYDPALGTAVRP
ncbi:MAG: phospholipid carrier-dependent glycosyltransferase [Gammaproteobacteria bacterium]